MANQTYTNILKRVFILRPQLKIEIFMFSSKIDTVCKFDHKNFNFFWSWKYNVFRIFNFFIFYLFLFYFFYIYIIIIFEKLNTKTSLLPTVKICIYEVLKEFQGYWCFFCKSVGENWKIYFPLKWKTRSPRTTSVCFLYGKV